MMLFDSDAKVTLSIAELPPLSVSGIRNIVSMTTGSSRHFIHYYRKGARKLCLADLFSSPVLVTIYSFSTLGASVRYAASEL